MRKILYSPGYGAGWVSWGPEHREQRLFMLEYQPFIECLEKGEGPLSGEHVLFERFQKDWDEKFPESKGDYPYPGGLEKLKVLVVPDGATVRIREREGYETVDLQPHDLEWL